MGVDHYENFPVASFLLPPRFRNPVKTIYAFARQADDFADEGDAAPAQRLAQLGTFRNELIHLAKGEKPKIELFVAIKDIVDQYGLPLSLFHDLLDAFTQDVIKSRYASFKEVLAYCEKSANPVGRLLLHLYGAYGNENGLASDNICTSLQLINFLQDIEIDYQKDRIYLAQDEMADYNITEADIRDKKSGTRWNDFMNFQINRTRKMLLSGLPLSHALRGRIGLELRMIIAGGERILDKLEQIKGDVFRYRPQLSTTDWFVMAGKAIFQNR